MSIDIDKLEALARAATPQNFDTAQYVEDDGWIECQACGGEGAVELHSDYCNYDDAALGVQFYGIGDEHVNAEAYYRAAKPATVTELITRLRESEQREQALATHVERLHEAFDESMELHREACAQDGEWPNELEFAAEIWMAKEEPKNSLARLKAQWQAEGKAEFADYLIRKCADHRDPDNVVVPAIEIERLRVAALRQSQEPTQ